MEQNQLEELLNVSTWALGNLLEFGTGIVIHEETASYVILNEYTEDDEGKEMFDVTIMKYDPDDEYVSKFDNGSLIIFDQDVEKNQPPKLKLVK